MLFLRTASVIVLGASIVLGAMLAGCQSMAASQAAARKIQAANPGARVGVVDQVLPDKPWVSVQGLPADQIDPGMVVTIVDQRQNTLANGVVEGNQRARQGPRVQVKYQPPGIARRDPKRGDLVVWFPQGKAPAIEQAGEQEIPQPTAQEATQRMRAHQMLESSPPISAPSSGPATQPGFH